MRMNVQAMVRITVGVGELKMDHTHTHTNISFHVNTFRVQTGSCLVLEDMTSTFYRVEKRGGERETGIDWTIKLEDE